jgi:hypothetical protein
MSCELTLHAIPEDTRLFELAAISRDHGESLQYLDMYLCGRYGRSSGEVSAFGNEIDRLFDAEAQQMKRTHPGIELRFVNLDQEWDELHFLLSEVRRAEPYSPGGKVSRTDDKILLADDYGTKAIRGERGVHENAVTGEGYPMRYVSATSAVLLASWLNGITQEELRSVYNPDAMESACVYRFSKSTSTDMSTEEIDEHNFKYIVSKYFEPLKAFYKTIAENREGALVIQD